MCKYTNKDLLLINGTYEVNEKFYEGFGKHKDLISEFRKLANTKATYYPKPGKTRLELLEGDKSDSSRDNFLVWLINQWEKQKFCCYYCGLTKKEYAKLAIFKKQPTEKQNEKGEDPNYGITLNGKQKRSLPTFELDQKDCIVEEKPYSDYENLVIACHYCNNLKSNLFTEEETKEIGKAVRKVHLERIRKEGK